MERLCVNKYTNFATAQQGEHVRIDVLRHLDLFRVMTNSQGKKEKKEAV